MVAGNAPDAERMDVARQLLGSLPDSNWLKRNPHVGDYVHQGDAGVYDLLLHRRDRAYSVPELAGLLQQGGMRPVNFVDPARYEPTVYLADRALAERLKPLNWLQRCTFAELLAGNMKTHTVYAVQGDNRTNTLAVPDSLDVVPVMREDDGPALAQQIKPGMALNIDMEGVKLSLPLPEQAAAILAQIDGKKIPVGYSRRHGQPAGCGRVQAAVRPALQLVLRHQPDVFEEASLNWLGLSSRSPLRPASGRSRG